MNYQENSIHLTDRETSVLRLVALGLSAKEAALELFIAPCTVERHIENVRLKTRTRNRAHMIAHVIREGLLPVEPTKSDLRINHQLIAESYRSGL